MKVEHQSQYFTSKALVDVKRWINVTAVKSSK